MKTITLLVVTLSTGLLILADSAEAASKESWAREAGIRFEESYQNLDIVQEKGKQIRAYYMKDGSIGSAISIDSGETFVDQGTLFPGSHHALVLLTGKTTRMYYTTPDTGAFVSAVSDNGTTFTVESGERTSGVGMITHPSIVKGGDNTLKIFYDEEISGTPAFGKSIKSLTCSSDGLTCTRDKGIRIKRRSCRTFTKKEKRRLKKRGVLCDVGMVWSPFLEYDNTVGQYRMYFSVEGSPKRSGIYLATSSNGTRFAIKNKVLGVNPDAPSGNGSSGMLGNPQDAFIFTSGGVHLMYVWETDDGIYRAVLQP